MRATQTAAAIVALAAIVGACRPLTQKEFEELSAAPSPLPAPRDIPPAAPPPDVPPARPALVLEVPRQITFSHVIGQTPCPQELRITIRRVSGDAGAPITITSRHGALRVALMSPTIYLREGEEITVVVFFVCHERDSFEGAIRISDGAGSEPRIYDVAVFGSLTR